jgi:hypothetical protein
MTAQAPHALSTAARWFGVGSSDDADPRVAGAAAARAALTGPDAKLVIVFCADSYDLPAVLAAINDETEEVPLIGCSTAGEIAGDRFSRGSVVVTALGGSGFTIATAGADIDGEGPRAAGAKAASCADFAKESEHRVLMLLIDGLEMHQEEILRGAYSVVGASVPLVGGAAGDDLKAGRTVQFHGRDVIYSGVVAALIESDAPLGIGMRHGWSRVGEPMTVTKTSGGRLCTLDGKPALDAYLDRVAAPHEAYVDAAAFHAFSVTRPLSVRRRVGQEIRALNSLPDFADRSISCGGEVPEGVQIWVMHGDSDALLGATDEACSNALDALYGQPPIGLMAFDCVARHEVLGSAGVEDELGRISKKADGARISGFYTYGEIARVEGINGFHHNSLVVLAIA